MVSRHVGKVIYIRYSPILHPTLMIPSVRSSIHLTDRHRRSLFIVLSSSCQSTCGLAGSMLLGVLFFVLLNPGIVVLGHSQTY